MKIKTLIAEDEPHSMSRMVKILSEFEEIDIVAQASDGNEALNLIKEKSPELLFLDINMPGKTGFEIIQEIDYEPYIIFVTAYEKYAIQAFEENAVDYILKPTNSERVKKSLDKIKEKNQKVDNKMIDILEKIMQKENYMNRFSIKNNDEIILIPEDDVFYFKAQDKYTFLCTYDEEMFFDTSLKKLEEKLNPEKFIRIHKSYIVSLNKINKIQKLFLREYLIELKDKNKTLLKVGRSYLSSLKNELDF
ncbi:MULTISPECIES: LytR/AlgR family response regulator transcription factor [Oceanotoga]|jgi:DNA-binding LytR/AlgR family response regulator|uniref:LytTR family two component transcriptional regulator n=1 Tax=Oceanotoga teriensis TaxID=515440 RepID=A0AA45C5P3_9BACT|nr:MULTISPECIES: LytTR family DNA-binding domain-containing protein [Oceanotoga]MDN5341701.1 two-component system, LytTR family, response regulator LytT [Oceanotoga sp.]MDO7976345.1 LytTR family DNA-binding domain-containing protein [Oceanotoga teriensis]PWJ89280.1 LytTR family two component transcriptional regulator [Oceanotoga teriensis]